MSAVTRHLFDEAEEDRVTGESASGGGQTAAPAASSTESSGASRASARASGASGKGRNAAREAPGNAVRRAGTRPGRASAPVEDDVWSQGVEAADGTGRVVGPESRVQPGRSVARIEGVRPEAADRVGRSPRMRIASWGALLAALAALVVVLAAGWFEAPGAAGSDSPSGTDRPRDGNRSPR